MVQFAGGESGVKVLLVGCIGLLDGPSCGGVETRHRQPQCTRSRNGEFFLDEALAKGPSAHHQTTVIVLDGTRKDFTCRSRAFVHENRKGPTCIAPLAPAGVVASWRGLPLGVHNGLVLVEKQIDHLHNGIEVSSSVPPQVHDDRRRTLLGQKVHCLLKLLCGVGRKTDGLDVPNLFLEKKGRHHALDRDSVALQMDVQSASPAMNGQMHLRAPRAFQQCHDPAVGEGGA